MANFLFAMAQALWLLAPLLFAAAVMGFVIRRDLLRWARRPIDGGREFRGRRVFGDHKTWRGVLVAVVSAAAFAGLQGHVVGDATGSLGVVDWREVPPVAFGALMGLGAMLGELPNSFVKRRVGIAPGKTTSGGWSVLFYVWDQVDLVFGAWALTWWWVRSSALLIAASFAVALIAHPLVSLVGWLVGARQHAR
jgi:CDP-diglyceride synthetase